MSHAKTEIEQQEDRPDSRKRAEQDFIAYLRYLSHNADKAKRPHLREVLRSIVEDIEDNKYINEAYQL